MFYWITMSAVLAADFITKRLVVNNLKLFESYPVINGALYFTHVENKGAAFGILQSARIYFIIATVLIICAIIFYIRIKKPKGKFLNIGIALVLAGAVGNFVDRVNTGAVIDFIDFRIIKFAIFNIADSAVVVGTFLICLHYCLLNDNSNNKNEIA